MLRRLQSLAPLAAILAAVACQPPPQEPAEEPAPQRTTQQVEAEAEAIGAEWQALANAGDAAGVTAFYAPGAVFTDPYGNVYEGPAAIREYLESSFTAGGDLAIVTTGVLFHGDMVATYGTWTRTVQGPEGDMPLAGMWQSVSMYQSDGSPRILLHQSMIPAEPPPTG